IAGGYADILLTHESPDVDTVPNVRRILNTNPGGYPNSALAESLASRQQIDLVRDAVHPRLHAHGHLHVYGTNGLPDKRFVASVAADGAPYSVMLLDLETRRLTRVNL